MFSVDNVGVEYAVVPPVRDSRLYLLWNSFSRNVSVIWYLFMGKRERSQLWFHLVGKESEIGLAVLTEKLVKDQEGLVKLR